MTWPPKTPSLTVDIIIELRGGGIVLIERKNPPRGYALPGGFVDLGETVEQAAIREAKEETGLDVTLMRQFHVYSDPSRDDRMHTVSVVFIATAKGTPRAATDAKEVLIAYRDALPAPLCFDHERILNDYYSGRF
ncbi:MAG: NUDIX hydrolase [Deltaproteobacteria bacterium]|nr:NUDIX hydrolase [Deltaproteobacteria bacterium]